MKSARRHFRGRFLDRGCLCAPLLTQEPCHATSSKLHFMLHVVWHKKFTIVGEISDDGLSRAAMTMPRFTNDGLAKPVRVSAIFENALDLTMRGHSMRESSSTTDFSRKPLEPSTSSSASCELSTRPLVWSGTQGVSSSFSDRLTSLSVLGYWF